MNELSIFIDESGDFGEYDYRSPYYIKEEPGNRHAGSRSPLRSGRPKAEVHWTSWALLSALKKGYWP